jgi:hypothetical protein
MKLKHMLTESTYTENALFCKKFVLAQPQFAANKWSMIGGYNYRTIAGSDKLSQHAYGNAWDWSGSKSTMEALKNFLIKHGKKLNVQYIIYNTKTYSAPSFNERTYTGPNPHTDHVHVDFITGTKPSYDLYVNAKLEIIFDRFYNMITKNPKKYFSSYTSLINDDEAGASSFLIDEFNKYVWRLNFWNRVADEKNKKNIETLRRVIELISSDIKNKKNKKYEVVFYKNNGSSYTTKTYNFKWIYF